MKKSGAKAKTPTIDDLLGSDDVPPAPKPATIKKGATMPALGGKQKQSDVDFYKSLAEDAGDSDMSDADADAVAKSLQGLDNLDDDLFGSLGKKKAPSSSKPTTPASKASTSDGGANTPASKPSTPASAAVTTSARSTGVPAAASLAMPAKSEETKQLGPKKPTLEELLAKPEVPTDDIGLGTLPAKKSAAASEADSFSRARSAPAAGSTVKKDKSMDFDDDDPLAGLLSDDEEDMTAKRKAKGKKAAGRESDNAAAPVQMRDADTGGPALHSSISSSAVPADRISLHERPPTRSGSRVSSIEDGGDINTALPVTPRQAKKKAAIVQDDPELDDTALEPSSSKAVQKKPIQKEQAIDFDDDDPLASLGLDDDDGDNRRRARKGSSSAGDESSRPASAFMDSLLGRPSSAEMPSQRKESILERKNSTGGSGGAAAVSTGRGILSAPAAEPKHARERAHDASPSNSPGGGDDEDFGFGAYMPSAASTMGSRPASQRSVRFEDEERSDDQVGKRQSGLSRTIGGGDDWLAAPSRKPQQRPLGLSATLGGPAADAADDWLSLASSKKDDDNETSPARSATTRKPPVPTALKAKASPTSDARQVDLGQAKPDLSKPTPDPGGADNAAGDRATSSPLVRSRPSVDGLAQQPASPTSGSVGRRTSLVLGDDVASTAVTRQDGRSMAGGGELVAKNFSPAAATESGTASTGSDGEDADWLGIKKRQGTGTGRKQQQSEAGADDDWLSATFSSRLRGNTASSSSPTADELPMASSSAKAGSSAGRAAPSEAALKPEMDDDWLGLASGSVADASVQSKRQPRRSKQPDEGTVSVGGLADAASTLPSSTNPVTAPRDTSRVAKSTAAEQQPVQPKSLSASAPLELRLDYGGAVKSGPAAPSQQQVQYDGSQKLGLQLPSREQQELDMMWQQQQVELQDQLKLQQEQGLAALRRQQELADLRQRQHERVQQQLIEHQRRMQEGVLLVQQQLQAAFDGSSMLLPPNVTTQVQTDMALKQVELEGKVRKLEMEKDHLQGLIESTKLRHLEEIAALETSYKGRQQLADETFQRREARLKEENQALARENMSRIKQVEEEKATVMALHYRRLEENEREKIAEIERMREQHRLALERLRSDHADSLDRLKKAKDAEIEALSNAHSRTNSFQFLVDQMKHNASDLTSLQHRLESQHSNLLDERELAARTRDEQLKVLQERLLMQQEDNDKERTRLQELIVKMEVQLREQGRQLQEEQWKLSQEKSKLAALQTSVEEEKRIVTDELSRERNELRRAKENLLLEQKQILSQLYEERRTLAEERSHFDASQRMLLDREHRDTLRHSQGSAEYEGLMKTVSEESTKLARRSQEIAKEEERLSSERARLELDKARVLQEKETLADLARRLRERSGEVEQMCQAAIVAREEGTSALIRAQQIQSGHEHRLASIQSRLQDLSAKEKQLAEEKIVLAQERNRVNNTAPKCAVCQGHMQHSSTVNAPPRAFGPLQASDRRDQLADLTNISVVRFGLQAELDQDYLEDEKMYLEALKHAPYHTAQQVA